MASAESRRRNGVVNRNTQKTLKKEWGCQLQHSDDVFYFSVWWKAVSGKKISTKQTPDGSKSTPPDHFTILGILSMHFFIIRRIMLEESTKQSFTAAVFEVHINANQPSSEPISL